MTPPTDLVEAKEQLEKATERIAALTEEVENLKERLAKFSNHAFGTRREKIDPKQLLLFERGLQELAVLQEALDSQSKGNEEKTPKKQGKRSGGRAPFAPHLPRKIIELDVPEDERCCPDCGELMHSIGVDVTERGHLIPARMVVNRYERKKYACKKGHAVKSAPLPDGVIDKGKYEASVYAHIATSKYSDHMPLNRLENIFKRHGSHLARQTMWDLLVRLDELVAQPVLKEMRRQLLLEDTLQADETPVKVQREGERGTSRGFIWAWRNLRGSPVEKVLVEFKNDRSAKGPDAFLGKWTGTLLTDGYDGVNPVAVRNDIQRAGCWAHARRKFRDALGKNKKLSAGALRPIQRLFWIERAVMARAKRQGEAKGRSLNLEELALLRLDVRKRRSSPVLRKLYDHIFAIKESGAASGRNDLSKAVGYAINQRESLTELLRNGKIPIHNNDTERDLRHIVTGRKNWLIFGSERGGAVAARQYSLVMTCKLLKINPEAYLEDALKLVSTTPDSKIAELTPWGWAANLAEEPAV